ncbi:MAG: hypothetical protein J6T10_20880 [Methanobrevibacter sp.]|nr:hypothetical protein [Methanobrevibacter sp.]
MNDKVIQKALEYYIKELEKQNEALKTFIKQIAYAFNCEKDRDEIIKDILNTLSEYDMMFIDKEC